LPARRLSSRLRLSRDEENPNDSRLPLDCPSGYYYNLVSLANAPQRTTTKEEVFERTAIALGVALLFLFGYFGVGFSTKPGRAHEFSTPLDKRIPFIARSIWIYLWSFSASAIPLFIIRSPRLFRRTSLAFAIAILISLICFTVIPVTAIDLRASAEQVKAAVDPSHWAVSTVYSLDPPYNLFPSLHVSITALAAFSVWKVNRRFGAILFAGLGLVAVSVCTTKQHYLVDVIGGLIVAALAGGLSIRPYKAQGERLTYSWRGPVSYVGSMVLLYVGLYGSYRWAGMSH